MRMLALSDVHSNRTVVRRMRAQEPNAYDLIIAAGDIGNDKAGHVMEVLASFGCPVLYVLGNHDGDVRYGPEFGPSCHHLHHRIFEQEGLAFVGYSGLPGNWGQNPIALELQAEVERKHAEVIALTAELGEAERVAVARIEAETADDLGKLHGKVGDRRSSRYRDGAHRIAVRRDARVEAATYPGRRLRYTQAWLAMEQDGAEAHAAALAPNRARLAEMVREADPRRCVVVTHERQPRTAVDMPGTALFLFGHVHGYSDTTFKGSRFVNVSALDDTASGPFGAGPAAQARMGTYTVIEIRGEIVSERRRLT